MIDIGVGTIPDYAITSEVVTALTPYVAKGVDPEAAAAGIALALDILADRGVGGREIARHLAVLLSGT